jgi:nucleoside-diphosphate kinase
MPDPNHTERTLVIVKPDAVHRQLTGEILRRLERKGLRIVAMKMLQIDRELAEKHYAVHKGKSFYDLLLSFITSGPSAAVVFEGEQAISIVRQMMGATNPLNAEPGTIRGDFAVHTTYNLIHGSDSAETARYEIDLFFAPHEIVSYPLSRPLYGMAW